MNTRISPVSELVGVDNEMSQIRRLRYFIEGQDCQLNENIIYQDNQSAVKLENNGKASCEKRTRNINIRYFFVTDHIQAKGLSVKYCPILEIIGDYFVEAITREHIPEIQKPNAWNQRRWYLKLQCQSSRSDQAKESKVLSHYHSWLRDPVSVLGWSEQAKQKEAIELAKQKTESLNNQGYGLNEKGEHQEF